MGWRSRAGTDGLAVAGAVLASVTLLLPWLSPNRPRRPQATVAARAAPAPSAHLKNGLCLVSGAPSPIRGTAALVVAPHPTGFTILWLPGFNSTACAIATTQAGAAAAAALARAITHAPVVSNGAGFSCPEDDGTLRPDLLHLRPSPVGDRASSSDLDGCRFISQSGRQQRSMTAGISDKLAALAPCRWQTYFADSTGAC